MTRLDDAELDAQLRRRGSGEESSMSRLADQIRDRVGPIPPHRPRLWNRLLVSHETRRWSVSTQWAAVCGAVALVAILAASGLLRGPLTASIAPGRSEEGSESPTSLASPAFAFPAIGADELIALVRQARASGEGSGRTVIADLTFDLQGDCLGTPNAASCYPVVRGSAPAIRLADAPTGFPCPVGARCSAPEWPFLPTNGPFALTIRGDGTVAWVGWVATQNDGAVIWPFDVLRDRLAGLSRLETDAYKLYAVSGWASALSGVVDCFGPVPSARDVEYGACEGAGRPVFLTAGRPTVIRAGFPVNAIHLQNSAFYSGLAIANAQTTYVVRPHVLPTGAMSDAIGPVAELVGRLDPLTPTSTPAPVVTLSPAAAAARSIVERFEVARTEGDWPTAWALLGPWTRSFFGSIETFARSEAASDAEGNTLYEIDDPVRDPAFLKPSVLGAAAWSELDPATAWYVAIHLSAVGGEPTSFEDVVVATGADGHLHIWIIH